MPATTRARKRAIDEDALRNGSPPRKKRRYARLSAHKMRTRSRADQIDLMSFPPEIRNSIYSHMYRREDATEIAKLRLPSSIRVPGLFTEALPIFFESTHITVPVRSNWCVRHSHLHTPYHMNYDTTGTFMLSAMLARVPESLVRFRKVSFEISCCCCVGFRLIAEFGVEAKGQDISCNKDLSCREVLVDDKPQVIEGLDRMLDTAEKFVKTEIEGRDGFNGFAVDDLMSIALCFRDTSKNRDYVDSGEAY